jgi:hypothetical protein
MDIARVPSADTGRRIPGKKPHPPVIESRMGEMMFTHFGIGGPVTLLMSLAIAEALEKGPVSIAIDLKPTLNANQLRARLQRDFDAHGRRSCLSIVEALVPRKMANPIMNLVGIASDKPAHQVTASERECLVQVLKAMQFTVRRPLPLSSAMITAGGVSLEEVDPRTMASRIIRGLYFSGEILDLDADTGGYNLQAAFSTGYVAGASAAEYLHSRK